MMYLEMSRDEAHGGGTWAFPNCVWAPTEKEGGGTWPFWTKVRHVQTGDIVLHLRGIQPNAKFVGYSQAASDGFETTQRPPDPKAWSYSQRFFRADLGEFVQFHELIKLTDVFAARADALNAYFDRNKQLGSKKLHLFYVRQNARLQCLNGAYLSDVDQELFDALFGLSDRPNQVIESPLPVSVQTGSQLMTVKTRLGQSAFSREIKKLYGNACCFPGCQVADPRFLIAAHIARWSDNERFRGNLGNGLCLCLIHDKAFEIGMFTLDQKYRVFVNPRKFSGNSSIGHALRAQQGKQIRLAASRPLVDALLEHWIRVDVDPESDA